MPKRILTGTVVSSNTNKTIIVKVTRRVKHKLYKKIISQSKKYHAHDENNNFKIGDSVRIVESKPISKLSGKYSQQFLYWPTICLAKNIF